MEIIANVYDKELNGIGYLDNISELVRTYKYREAGKFSLRLPVNGDDIGLLFAGFIIVFTDAPTEGYLIESVNPSQDLPNVAEVTGRDLRALFAFRVINNQTVDGSMSNRMYWLIHNNAVSPADTRRALPYMQDLDRTSVGDDLGPAANQQMTGTNLLTALVDTIGTDAYGWRVDLDLSEKTITPVFYIGTDLTNTLLFDDVLCTMDSCEYTRDTSDYCTVAAVAGKGKVQHENGRVLISRALRPERLLVIIAANCLLTRGICNQQARMHLETKQRCLTRITSRSCKIAVLKS